MQPVILHIEHVVDDVDRGRESAEGREAGCGEQERLGRPPPMRGEDGKEDQRILRPLVWPEQPQESWHTRSALQKKEFDTGSVGRHASGA